MKNFILKYLFGIVITKYTVGAITDETENAMKMVTLECTRALQKEVKVKIEIIPVLHEKKVLIKGEAQIITLK